MQKKFIAIFLSGVWITFSEFLRNEILFKSYWVEHFSSLGLKFETLPVNGFLWFVWSMLLAYFIFRLLQKFTPRDTLFIAWIAAFVMMWITAFNLQVLPLGLLIFAIPLSVVEVIVAVAILSRKSNPE